MYKNLSLLLFLFFFQNCGSLKFPHEPLLINNQNKGKEKIGKTQKNNWSLLDLNKDSIPGMSVNRAKEELLKDNKGRSVIVAVIDSGVDIEHPLISGSTWINKKEIPGNNIDDDKNGYIDDINGWNFLGKSNKENMEYVRLIKNTSKNDSLYNVYLKEIDEVKNTSTQRIERSKDIINKHTKYDSIIRSALDKNFYSLDEAEKINFKTLDVLDAIDFLTFFEKNSLSIERLEGAIKYYKTRLKYHINIDFEGRSIVGDDPNNLYNTDYGNPNVIGPEKNSADHGTHVCGIILSIYNKVKIMPLRAVPDGDEYDKDIALAIRYAVNNGAKIINTSFGKSYSPHSDWVNDAIKYASRKDVLIVNASGNDSKNINPGLNKIFPNDEINGKENTDNMIIVGASTFMYNEKLPAYFSNFGSINVDLFAPGYQIYSSVPNNKYDYNSGTSMAAPSVSGVAAVIRSFYPNLKAPTVKRILLESGSPMYKSLYSPESQEIVPPKELSKSGKIVNLYNALLLASLTKQK
jgi:subtilisin family serine protease